MALPGVPFEYYASQSGLIPKNKYTLHQHEYAYFKARTSLINGLPLGSYASEFYRKNSGLASTATDNEHFYAYYNLLDDTYSVAWTNELRAESISQRTRINLVVNPNFTTNVNGWFGYYSPTIDRVTNDFHTGPGAGRLVRGSGPAQGAITTSVATAVPGQVYHFSAWVKAPVGLSYLVTLKHDDGASGVLPEVHVGNGTWRFHDKTYTVPAIPEGLGYLRPMFIAYEADIASAGVAVGQPFLWFDDVLWELGTNGAYFDGNTNGAIWTGTINESTSAQFPELT